MMSLRRSTFATQAAGWLLGLWLAVTLVKFGNPVIFESKISPPATFAEFSGDLLVGNFGDGTISVFDAPTNTFLGLLPGVDGNPVRIDGLWGRMIGNGGNSGSPGKVYFTAGPDEETHGLFGVLAEIFVGTDRGHDVMLGGSVRGLTLARERAEPRVGRFR